MGEQTIMPVIGQRPEITLDDIVLATDFSDAAVRATQYAAEIARRYGSRLHLVSVVNLNIPIAAGDGTCVLPVKELADNTLALLTDLAASLKNVSCTIYVPEAFSVSQAIQEIVKACKASLVVMGTTSKGILKKAILGSTAEEVIRTSKIPVLTVGPHVRASTEALVPFQRIVFANDWSDRARRTLPIALAFAQDGGAHLYLCRVAPEHANGESPSDDTELLRALEASIPRSAADWCKPECVVQHGEAANSIVAIARETNADLIVLAARAPTLRLSYLEQGVTPQVIANATCPVLSYCP